jgi:hypothetical protein
MKSLFTRTLLLFLAAPALALIDPWPEPETAPAARESKPLAPTAPHDLTPAFQSTIEDVEAGIAEPLAPSTLKRHKVLLVKGFLGNHISGYMEMMLLRFRGLGFDADFIPVATEGGFEDDLRKIESAVAAAPRERVLLLGHSRGGILIHDWLRRASPELKGKTARAILLQAPLGGSEAADFILEHGATRGLARVMSLLPRWGDALRSLRELSTPSRKAALAGLPPMREEDLEKILAVQTAFVPGAAGEEGCHAEMKEAWSIVKSRSGLPGDGVVSTASSRLPGADSILLEGLDHEDTVLQNPGWLKELAGSRHCPGPSVGDLAEALLRVALSGSEIGRESLPGNEGSGLRSGPRARVDRDP